MMILPGNCCRFLSIAAYMYFVIIYLLHAHRPLVSRKFKESTRSVKQPPGRVFTVKYWLQPHYTSSVATLHLISVGMLPYATFSSWARPVAGLLGTCSDGPGEPGKGGERDMGPRVEVRGHAPARCVRLIGALSVREP